MVELSSTSIISLMSSGGERFTTEWTERSKTDQASLWKIIIIEALGKFVRNLPGSLHLKINVVKL